MDIGLLEDGGLADPKSEERSSSACMTLYFGLCSLFMKLLSPQGRYVLGCGQLDHEETQAEGYVEHQWIHRDPTS